MLDKPKDVMYCGVNQSKILNADPTLNDVGKGYLEEFIVDRYNVHINKDVMMLPKPWTDNPVFLDVKFTNVRREHDRNTIWAIDHICKSPNLSMVDKIYNIILFRLYNKWQTCELIGMPFRTSMLKSGRDQIKGCLERKEMLDPDYVFFTSAFNTGGMKAAVGRTTGEQYIPMRPIAFLEHMIDDGLCQRIRDAKDQKSVCDELMKYSGIGEFLSYQMFVDFTYIEDFPFSENHYTIAGPGCKLGVDQLFDDKDGMTHEEALFWLRDNWLEVFPDMDLGLLMVDLPPHDRVMNIMSLENCHCELGKYIKCKEQVKDGKKPRARVSYAGTNQPEIKTKSKTKPIDDSERTIPYNGKRITQEEHDILTEAGSKLNTTIKRSPCYTATLFEPAPEFDTVMFGGEHLDFGNFFQFLGTNGSGKSTIPKGLVDRDKDAYTLTTDMVWLSGNMGKGFELETKEVTFATVCPNFNLVLMGDYTPGTNIAGCDVLIRATMELGLDIISLDEKLNKYSVLMEGVVLSSSRWHIDRIKSYGINGEAGIVPKMMFMDTPLDVCMERLVKRNATHGKTPNTKNVKSKWEETRHKAGRCIDGTHNYDGVNAIWVDHTMSIPESVNWFIKTYIYK